MEDVIINKLSKNMNFIERILLKVFKKTFMKAYHTARIDWFNFIVGKEV